MFTEIRKSRVSPKVQNNTESQAFIKKSLLTFQYNKFSDAEFIFGWAGYAAGNKLGFKMKLQA